MRSNGVKQPLPPSSRSRINYRAVSGKVLKGIATGVIAICAILYGCDLLLDAGELGFLLIGYLAAAILYWGGSKLDPR